MKTEPKYYKVLKYLYEKGRDGAHYIELAPIIYSDDVIKRYRAGRGKKAVIDYLVCTYMGKLARKDYCEAGYEHIDYGSRKGTSYFTGYYIRTEGIKLLKEKGLI